MLKHLLRFLGLLAFLMPGLAMAAAAPAGFETKAAQAFMIEAETGTVLLAKDEDKAFSPASLAKLMTLEVVFDALEKGEISLDTEYPVSEYAWRTGGAPSRTSTMFAALKSRIRVQDLIQGVAVQAANDGCIILAEGLSGSEASFAERMTKRAREIGLPRATFANSTGLPDPGNKISARELVTLARRLETSHRDLYRYFAQPDFEWNKIFQRNRNPLLGMDIGADGLAIGFAEGEGYSIVASVEKNGRRLFLALGGLASDKERSEEAKRVLEWGMTAFEDRQIFANGEVIGAASVYGGTASTVDLVAKMPVNVYLPVNNPERLAARIVYRWPLKAPVEQDVQVGTLRIFLGDRLLREVPLYTVQAVGQGSLGRRAVDAIFELGETVFFSWLWDKLEGT